MFLINFSESNMHDWIKISGESFIYERLGTEISKRQTN